MHFIYLYLQPNGKSTHNIIQVLTISQLQRLLHKS